MDATVVRMWRDSLRDACGVGHPAGSGEPPSEDEGLAGLDDRDRVDLLRALEELSCTIAGTQTVVTAAFEVSQRASQAAAGVPMSRRGRGIGTQVGLARRESPHRGASRVSVARTLTQEMPAVLAALTGGRISEWRATIITRETACLSATHRALVDDLLAGTPERVDELESLGDRRLQARVLGLVQSLDAAAQGERRRRAERERRVTCRPAPDTMMFLSAVLPVHEGVGVIAELDRAARAARSAGDERTRSQLMADILVERVTGRCPATGPTPVTLNVVVSTDTLFRTDAGSEGGHLDGFGPVPGAWIRDVAAAAGDPSMVVHLRRLFAAPESGELVGMESHRREFPAGLATLIRLRDHSCRTPWCDAPVRHTDHVVPVAEGGVTSAANGQGLCEACNHAKQAPGWSAEATGAPATRSGHRVTVITPTGHRYAADAPPMAG